MSILTSASQSLLRPARFSPLFLVLIGLALSGITLSSSEASAAKIVNYENEPVRTSLSVAKVKDGIIKAASARGWKIKETGPGELTAVIKVRTHTAAIKITYTQTTYSITYMDSANLKYKNGKIHRNYNKWIKFLKDDIDLEFSF